MECSAVYTLWCLFMVRITSRDNKRHSSRPWAGRSTDIRNTPCDVYIWLESRAEIINVSYRMDSAIAPGRHSASSFKFLWYCSMCSSNLLGHQFQCKPPQGIHYHLILPPGRPSNRMRPVPGQTGLQLGGTLRSPRGRGRAKGLWRLESPAAFKMPPSARACSHVHRDGDGPTVHVADVSAAGLSPMPRAA